MSRKSYLFASSRLVCDLKRVLGGKIKVDEKSLEIRFYDVREKTFWCPAPRRQAILGEVCLRHSPVSNQGR